MASFQVMFGDNHQDFGSGDPVSGWITFKPPPPPPLPFVHDVITLQISGDPVSGWISFKPPHLPFVHDVITLQILRVIKKTDNVDSVQTLATKTLTDAGQLDDDATFEFDFDNVALMKDSFQSGLVSLIYLLEVASTSFGSEQVELKVCNVNVGIPNGLLPNRCIEIDLRVGESYVKVLFSGDTFCLGSAMSGEVVFSADGLVNRISLGLIRKVSLIGGGCEILAVDEFEPNIPAMNWRNDQETKVGVSFVIPNDFAATQIVVDEFKVLYYLKLTFSGKVKVSKEKHVTKKLILSLQEEDDDDDLGGSDYGSSNSPGSHSSGDVCEEYDEVTEDREVKVKFWRSA